MHNRQQQRAQAASAYQAGQTLREIADRLGVHNSTVHRWLTAEGIKPRRSGPRGRVEISDRHITQLRETGWPYAAIGRLIGLSGPAVRARYLNQLSGAAATAR